MGNMEDDMITETEIFARLTALHSALVEKLGAQPFLEPNKLRLLRSRREYGGLDCDGRQWQRKHL